MKYIAPTTVVTKITFNAVMHHTSGCSGENPKHKNHRDDDDDDQDNQKNCLPIW